MASIVLEVLSHYEIAEKLFGITCDNAGNNGTLCKALEAKLAELGIDWDAEVILLSIIPNCRHVTSLASCILSIWQSNNSSTKSTTTLSVSTSTSSSRKFVPSPKVFGKAY